MAEGGEAMAADAGGSSALRQGNLVECKHPVFLSHSGAQKSFVEQFCLDVERHDIYPFFDKRWDSLPIGCNFPDEIFKAIKECHVAVVVLSEDFFTRSKWPMLELAALVKRKNVDSKLIIMPVYLGITYAQCRDRANQDRWMSVWESWVEEDSKIDLGEWKETLRVFGYTNSIHLNDKLDEVKCRGEIVKAICKEVPRQTRLDDSHVQGRTHLVSVVRTKIVGMEASKSYGARILGVYGVGGSGKTTICKVLCNDYFEEFEGKVCHVEFGIGSKLMRLQEMLRRLTRTNHKLIKRFSEDECKDKLKKDLSKKRLFLAIDNVSNSQVVDEAKDILRMGFFQESIVVVTARSSAQLSNLNLEECMEMPDLEEDDARSLFLYHAAPGSYLRHGEEIDENDLKQCIQRCYFGKGDGRCHYHPLALKVLGGQLGNDSSLWMEKVKRLDPFNQYQEAGKDHPIFSILGSSFETLKLDVKLLFMDVALYLPQESAHEINMNIFEWLSMVHGESVRDIVQKLVELKRKSLVESFGDGSKEIGMHDLLREFAVMKSVGEELDSRLWFYKRIGELYDPEGVEPNLSKGDGWERLQRISIEGELTEGCCVKGIDLSCYPYLRVLKLVDVALDNEVLDVSSLGELRSLQICYFSHGYPLDGIYQIFGLERRRVFPNPILEIRGLGLLERLVFLRFENIEIRTTLLDKEIKKLTSLQVLCMVNVDSSSGLPGWRGLNSLRDVIFHGFKEGSKISGLSSKMTNLKRLDLSECSSLLRCHGVGYLVALEVLDLSRCSRLEELPNLGRLQGLLELDVSHCELIKAVPGLGGVVSLREFRASGCESLAELPDMGKLVNLRILRLGGCPLIRAIPGLGKVIVLETLEATCEGLQGCDDLCNLVELERVLIYGWGAEGVPCLLRLMRLKRLCIDNGERELIGLSNLTGIEMLLISDCKDIMDLSCLSNLTALTDLLVHGCDELKRLPDMHTLSRLETLIISGCRSLREWRSGSGLRLSSISGPILPQLQMMNLQFVPFAVLPDLSRFPQLREVLIWSCDELTRLTSSAPLTALKRLSLKYCKSLRALPDVNHLVSLSAFTLKGCEELELTADEIVKLEAMCPGLELDKSHLPNTQLVNDDDDRDDENDDDENDDDENDDDDNDDDDNDDDDNDDDDNDDNDDDENDDNDDDETMMKIMTTVMIVRRMIEMLSD